MSVSLVKSFERHGKDLPFRNDVPFGLAIIVTVERENARRVPCWNARLDLGANAAAAEVETAKKAVRNMVAVFIGFEITRAVSADGKRKI